MTRACNKHSLHPVKGYNQCPGCEIEMYKKQLTELAEALREIRATEESESAAREMHAIAFDVLKEIEK